MVSSGNLELSGQVSVLSVGLSFTRGRESLSHLIESTHFSRFRVTGVLRAFRR
jgi:hypothetical protein